MLITQLTDLHLRPPGRAAYRVAETNMLTERALGRLRTLWPQPDVVVITGDMTDCGMPEEYALLRTLLSALPMPVFMVPGNHDRRDNLKRAFCRLADARGQPGFRAICRRRFSRALDRARHGCGKVERRCALQAAA